MSVFKKNVKLIITLIVLLLSQVSFAYCIAKTKCRNGDIIECGLPNFNYYGVIIVPYCETKVGESVSCRRQGVGGFGGASVYESCSYSNGPSLGSDGGYVTP